MIGVKGRFHNQSLFRRGVGDQINNYFKVYERAGAPVLGDETEQAMFNLVPFTCAGWEVTDEQPDAQFVGQVL